MSDRTRKDFRFALQMAVIAVCASAKGFGVQNMDTVLYIFAWGVNFYILGAVLQEWDTHRRDSKET